MLGTFVLPTAPWYDVRIVNTEGSDRLKETETELWPSSLKSTLLPDATEDRNSIHRPYEYDILPLRIMEIHHLPANPEHREGRECNIIILYVNWQ